MLNILETMRDTLTGATDTTAQKDAIARFLQTTPEALAEFEAAYTKAADSFENHDLMHASVHDFKDGTDAAADTESRDSGRLDAITTHIAADLLAMYGSDGRFLPDSEHQQAVFKADLQVFPDRQWPQLTATAAETTLAPSSWPIVLEMLRMSVEEHDRHAYHMFRQGLDILDLDPVLYEVLGMNKNSISHWFPVLSAATKATEFFKIPETKIVKVPLPILQLTRLDYASLTRATLDVVDKWAFQAFHLDESKTYFVKTGTYSSKYCFRNAKVEGAKEVRELGEYLLFIQSQAVEMAQPLTLPCPIYGASTTNEWCVREYIADTENNPCIYQGMPLHTEYRLFVDLDVGTVLGYCPYWRSDVMEQRFGREDDANSPHNIHDYVIYKAHEPVLMRRYEENIGKVVKAAEELIQHMGALGGQWSLDIMQNGNDFWLIDMATADTSALHDCVPEGLLKPQPENWVPQITVRNTMV